MIASSSGEISRFFSLGGTGGLLTCCAMTASAWPENGTDPVALSYSITPSEYRSVRWSSRFPRACSGLI